MEDFGFVQHMPCEECAKQLNKLDKDKQELLKTRVNLRHCKGCERLKDLKPNNEEE